MDMPVITTSDVHGVSPTTSVYQSSALLAHVTFPAPRPDLTREMRKRPAAKVDLIVDERVQLQEQFTRWAIRNKKNHPRPLGVQVVGWCPVYVTSL